MKWIYYYDFPIGTIGIGQTEDVLTNLYFGHEHIQPDFVLKETPLIKRAALQLAEYFAKKREGFDLPLEPQGTAFQKKVWEALLTIPYGQTRSYMDIAKQVGCPKGARAVGGANGKNPIPIFIPCHRVIAANGGLGGFSSGLPNKVQLLQLEQFKEE